MEIEFNLNRVATSNSSQPVARSSPAETPQDSASLGKTGALKSAVNNVPLVRPEKVDAARAAISDTKYPPDAMLKAIASLVAEKIQ
jgi:hypothetical protein